MPKGYTLRAYLFDGTLIHERSFAALPVRLGRNSLNDFQISQALISGFHAVLEPLQGKDICAILAARTVSWCGT